MHYAFLSAKYVCMVRQLFRVFWGLTFAVAALLPHYVCAQTVVFDNLAAARVGNFGISTNQWDGVAFQVGPTSQRISEWSIVAGGSGTSGNVTLSLYALDAGTNLPTGAALASAVVPFNIGTTNTYSAASLGAIANTVMNANTKYALVFGPPASGSRSLEVTNAARTFSGGFGAAGGDVESVNSGGTWSFAGFAFLGRLTVIPATSATTVSVPTLEFWSLTTLGLLVAGFGAHRMRPKNNSKI